MAPADPVGPLVLAASVAGIKTPPIRILDREITYPSRLKQVQEREGQEQMTRIINEFKEELNKVKGSSTEAAKAVNKFVKTYGLEKEFHAMKTPAGMFEIEKSPELKDLLKAFNDDPKTIYQPGTSKMVRELFSTMPSGTYTIDSRTTGTNGEDRIVFWRSEDERDREPKGLDEVRDQVVAAWKVILARDLARAEANALSKRIAEKAKQLDPKIVAKELADTTYGPEKKKIHPFDLKGSVQEGLVGTELTPLERSAANRTLVPIDKIAYPPSSFVTDILTLQKPGESKVLHDLPETHYYVTLLQERNNKTINDMVSEYANAMSPDSFWMESALLPEQRDYNDMVIRELRTIAAPKEVDDQGRYKLPDGISKRIFDSRGETDSE
jgi:predicted nucleic acid-binding Zn ribbon protein